MLKIFLPIHEIPTTLQHGARVSKCTKSCLVHLRVTTGSMPLIARDSKLKSTKRTDVSCDVCAHMSQSAEIAWLKYYRLTT